MTTTPRLSRYVSDNFSYGKEGVEVIPAGPKRYKSKKELVVPERGSMLGAGTLRQRMYWLIRLILTHLFGVVILCALIVSYSIGIRLAEDKDNRFAVGLYGVLLFIHLMTQTFFAALVHKRAGNDKFTPAQDYATQAKSKVAIQISAYQEDPDYLRVCLESVMNVKYPSDKKKVLCCIDGNQSKSAYMVDIFEDEVRKAGHDPVFFLWDYNFHQLPEDVDDNDNGVNALKECVLNNDYVCIMQKWGGKREVMYTAFRTLGDTVDYVQVCDSDTKLDPMATIELAWVLDAEPESGAVGGDVKILNDGDSLITFLSSLRYWIAFNIERACQSYFGCVSCISGPLGLYRMSVVQQVLDLWSDQKFLGSVCTFGDDRHLTNRILQMGYATKYTPRSTCLTETPAQYGRWLNQQIRWTKSFFREWLFNTKWWHKHHLWMIYESIISGVLPFFVMGAILFMSFSSDLWNLKFLLLTVQAIGLIKGFIACCIRRDLWMLFMSLYSVLYVTSLLPGKIYAILTIQKKSWGTSGRLHLLKNYECMLPVVVWAILLFTGFIQVILRNDYSQDDEARYLMFGTGSYVLYWILMLIWWKLFVEKKLRKKTDLSTVDNTSQDTIQV